MREGWGKRQREGRGRQDPHSGWFGVFSQKTKSAYRSSMYLSPSYWGMSSPGSEVLTNISIHHRVPDCWLGTCKEKTCSIQSVTIVVSILSHTFPPKRVAGDKPYLYGSPTWAGCWLPNLSPVSLTVVGAGDISNSGIFIVNICWFLCTRLRWDLTPLNH